MSHLLPLPALHASHAGTWLRDPNGSTRGCSKGEAVMAAADTPQLLMNAPLVASRLGYPDLSGLDLLELFAFVHPATFCVPTPKGLAHALGLDEPADDAGVPLLLQQAAGVLVATCESENWSQREGAWSSLQSLARLRWPWAGVLAPHIKRPDRAEKWLFSRLPEWEETPDRPQPAQVLIDEPAIEAQLERLTGEGAERREGQRAFSKGAGHVFGPRDSQKRPHILLAQA
ncbi:MAG: ATP-dependent DNA helicase, partial [Erythrobacter sp.]|nr:ATP-dependent DNA helicase [Erythrobacter sp.]